RLMQRQQVAVDQELEAFRPHRGGRGQQVRRIHQPVGRGVMLVKADAVIAEPVHFLPRRQMLGIGLRRDRGLEVLFLERERQLVGDFQVVEMLAIRQEVENEDFHCAKFLPASKKQKTLNHKDAKAPSSFSPRPTSPMIVLASWRLGGSTFYDTTDEG